MPGDVYLRQRIKLSIIPVMGQFDWPNRGE